MEKLLVMHLRPTKPFSFRRVDKQCLYKNLPGLSQYVLLSSEEPPRLIKKFIYLNKYNISN